MRHFEYISTRSIDEAYAALADHGSDACILAGGTDLLVEWRRPVGKSPKVVVDISCIKELKGIVSGSGEVTLMPLATHTEIMMSSVIRESAPLLSCATSNIGAPQIRNRGTVGGNIMNAATCADTVPPLITLGATVTLQSKAGLRQMDLVDLYIKPYQTNARADEILTGIRFAKLPPRTHSAFIKLGRRKALAISRLSVAACLTEGDNGKIIDARIVPGAAFPVWRRVKEAEQMLIGEKPSSRLFVACGQKVSEMMFAQTGRRWSTEYKEPVIAVLVRRALEQCVPTRGVEA
jgi:carbon-monoxide dehydrogenase medium subunit/xanthine dehydrogenase FAD-binding subunit